MTNTDIQIINEQKHNFLKPLKRAMQLSQIHKPIEEIVAEPEFKRAAHELQAIEAQGYKQQFFTFVELLFN